MIGIPAALAGRLLPWALVGALVALGALGLYVRNLEAKTAEATLELAEQANGTLSERLQAVHRERAAAERALAGYQMRAASIGAGLSQDRAWLRRELRRAATDDCARRAVPGDINRLLQRPDAAPVPGAGDAPAAADAARR